MGDSQSGGGRSEIGISELKVEVKPAFKVVKILGGDPLARAWSEEVVGSRFRSEDLRGRGEKLPEKSQDRETEDVVKSAFVLETNIKLAPRGASTNKLLVGVLPSRLGGPRAKCKAKILGGKREDDLVSVKEWALENISAEVLEVTLPKRNKDSLGDVEGKARHVAIGLRGVSWWQELCGGSFSQP